MTRYDYGLSEIARCSFRAGALLLALAHLSGCGGQLVAWPPEDVVPPTVIATVPDEDALGVMRNRTLSVTFSEAMDPDTLSVTSFVLFEGATQVLGTVSYSGVTATFDPTTDLDPATVYTATVSQSVEDLAGNNLAADHTWTFTTGSQLDAQRPVVTFSVPIDDATDVAPDASLVAVFSEAMDVATVDETTFTLANGVDTVLGSVTLTGATAMFDPAGTLAFDTEYTATITATAADLAGNTLLADYVWTFRTAAEVLLVAPRVTLTTPANLAEGVARNTPVTAAFSQPMTPLTAMNSLVVTEEGGDIVPGSLAYDMLTQTVTFVPTGLLAPFTEYTARVMTTATNLVGTALAVESTWTFTTEAVVEPRVIITSPVDLATGVLRDAIVSVTFSEPMNAVTAQASFSVLDPDGNPVLGDLSFDVLSQTLVFVPDDFLEANATYTATVTSDATSLLGAPLAADYEWAFTTGIQAAGMLPVNLGSLTTFVAAAGAGLTNSNSSGMTTLGGDVALSPTGTCLGDGLVCTALNPLITGMLFGPGLVAATAKADLLVAYMDAASRPPGTLVNDISGLVLQPGVYTSASTMSIAVGGTVTLDGNGDPNAVFIFQVGSSLTVNNNAQVLLINGARARNVFWAIAASSTIGSNVSFLGSVMAGASNSVGTDSTVVGRLLCTTGQITLLSNSITLPL